MIMWFTYIKMIKHLNLISKENPLKPTEWESECVRERWAISKSIFIFYQVRTSVGILHLSLHFRLPFYLVCCALVRRTPPAGHFLLFKSNYTRIERFGPLSTSHRLVLAPVYILVIYKMIGSAFILTIFQIFSFTFVLQVE